MAKITIKQLPSEITEELLKNAQQYVSANEDLNEDLLEFLKKEKISKIHSIFIYAILKDIDVNEAKSVVHFSKAWSQNRETDEKLQESFLNSLK